MIATSEENKLIPAETDRKITRHDASVICELNPKYDGDINKTIRGQRIDSMLRYANMTRSERRSRGWIPSPFDNVDLEYLEIARNGGFKKPHQIGQDI